MTSEKAETKAIGGAYSQHWVMAHRTATTSSLVRHKDVSWIHLLTRWTAAQPHSSSESFTTEQLQQQCTTFHSIPNKPASDRQIKFIEELASPVRVLSSTHRNDTSQMQAKWSKPKVHKQTWQEKILYWLYLISVSSANLKVQRSRATLHNTLQRPLAAPQHPSLPCAG